MIINIKKTILYAFLKEKIKEAFFGNINYQLKEYKNKNNNQ